MAWLRGRLRPWWLEGVLISGLLLAIAVAGMVGLGINTGVKSVTDQALKYDVQLEDRSDDFRVAVLDMRHFHRNLVFAGPTERGLADFEAAYLQLHMRIDQLDQLGIEDSDILRPEQLRLVAQRYYVEFRPAIDVYHSDPRHFSLASDEGLVRLAELEDVARAIDHLGEQRAAAALRSVEAATDGARVVLITVLAGLILVGAGLAYLMVRNLREQRRAAAHLAHALQLKNDFIADASHELRTPLTVLRANAEVALELNRTCIHTELLEEIVRESARMTRLVEDLLFLARSDAGSLPLELEWVNIEPFLIELADRAGIIARQSNSPFHKELAAQGRIRIDRSRIEQVVLILVDNAGKYGAAGKPITLRSATRGAELIIEVADRGPGIAASDLPLVFERFYRLDKARTRKQGGAGLGLAIAKSIIQAHGGRIEVESVLRKGTKMRFYLPLVALPQPARSSAGQLIVVDAS
jgi:signal transduction histidine kinase